MPKDFLLFGGLAGIVGNLTKEIIIWGLYGLGFMKLTFVHYCAGTVLPHTTIKEPLAILIGMLIDHTLAFCFGAVFYYIYLRFGSAYFTVKGLGFGMIIFLFCYGILRPLFSINLPQPPYAVFFYMVANLFYGLTMSIFAKKYAPDKPHTKTAPR